jgi:hypothetical protein
VQHVERHVPGGQPVAARQCAPTHALRVESVEDVPHRRIRPVADRRSVRHLADRETLHQFEDAVEVVEVGVRQEQFVHGADAAPPQVRRDLMPHDAGAAH